MHLIVALWLALPAAGQIAITEVMSSPSLLRVQADDFWELTNFGTDAVDVSSYWFRDEGGISGAESLTNLWASNKIDSHFIGPGESVILVRSRPGVITTPDEFRQWWGEDGLRQDLKIILYQGYGFNAGMDAVQLWNVTEDGTNLVQRVELFEAFPGRTFTYDSATGTLDVFSIAGHEGAFVAAASDDVGSPGITTGPVPLSVVQHPASAEVDAGSPVTMTVRVQGLPAPRYQWRHDKKPILGATRPTYFIAAATPCDAGDYDVKLDNGLEYLLTTNATLIVNTSNWCAAIVRPPADVEVLPEQTACFSVETRGYPLPTFQWRFNGVDILGATASALTISEVGESQTGLYTVHVTNPLCSTNASAWLSVVQESNLIITEAMATPSTNTLVAGHDDWWELTNVGVRPVNLRGYRWDDQNPSLSNPVVVKNDVILQPGQSAIFVSSMTAEAFRRWWGPENLPDHLQIISYFGNGLSSIGDQVVLWNATACRDEDYLFSYAVLDQTEPPTQGVSLECDPDFEDCGIPSVAGQRGAFQAAESDDVGSPGWTSNEQRAAPRYPSICQEDAGFVLRWKTEPGRTYTLRYCADLTVSDWTPWISLPADGPWLSVTNLPAAGVGRRFYSVHVQPLGP